MIKTTIIAYGENYLKGLETYIYRLDRDLSIYYPSISWHICHLAIKRTTTRKLVKEVEDKLAILHPNIVFINLSSTDSCTQDSQFIEIKEFEDNLITILENIRIHKNRTGLNGCIPIPLIITPPPVDEGITGLSRTNNRLKQYVYVAKKIAKTLNIPLIDLFNHLIEKEDYKDYLGEDGISLNQKGHDVLYDLAFLELIKLINYQGVIKDRDVIFEDEMMY